MKKAVLIVVVMMMMTAAGVMAAEENRQQPGDDYILGPGDVLDISVWKVEELTKMVTVLPDGRIAFPLIGQITAGGKTVDELSRELEKKLIKFVPDLNLTVMVQQVNSMMIYVIGEVHNPGRFILNSNINVLQALALAGGLDTFAKAGKIKIFREAGKGTEIIGYDYEEVTEGNELGQNILLKRGDVIFVP
jgi:polysaccharide export outer membrane protein